MQVRVLYKDGQVRIVDTNTFTVASDSAISALKNVGTIFNVRVDRLDEEGLWIEVLATDAGNAFIEEDRRICPVTTEYAMQVIDLPELANILEVKIDDTVILTAYGKDGLINVPRFDAQVKRIVAGKEDASMQLQAFEVFKQLLSEAPNTLTDQEQKTWAAKEMGWRLQDIEPLYDMMCEREEVLSTKDALDLHPEDAPSDALKYSDER